MSFRLSIDENVYIIGSRDLIKTEFDLGNGRVSLRGFYFGSGTCLDGTGSSWIVKIKSYYSPATNTVNFILSDSKKINLKLYYHNKLVEEVQVQYPYFDMRDEIEVDSLWIKKVYLRSLERWTGNGEATPLEIAGVEIQKQPN